MTPAMASGCSPPSVMSRSSVCRVRSTSSRVVSISPARARRTTTEPESRSTSKAWSGWPTAEHDVVGDVDGERDGTHAHLGQALAHPGRRRPGRVDAAHDPGDVAVAPVVAVDGRVVLELDRVAACGGGRRRDVGRVAVAALGAALRVPVLAGEATHREAVAAVGRHVRLDGLVGEPEEGDRVVAGAQGRRALLAEQPAEHDDALVVVSETDLVLGADHPVGDVAVRLARGDREAPGQHGTGQHARRRGRRPRSCGHRRRSPGACPRSASGRSGRRRRCTSGSSCRSSAARASKDEDPTDDERTGDVATVEVLLLETHADEAGGHVGTPGPGREVGVLGEPAQWHTHVRPPSRTAARSGRRPRRCRASPGPRGAAGAPARCRARRRSRSRRPGRCRRCAAPCG